MKKLNLFLCMLLSCCCSLSYAYDCSKKAVCDKGIFPQTAPDQQGVTPSMTEEEDNAEDTDF